LDDFRGFLPEPAAQARLRTQQDLLEIESYEKVEPQAPVNGRRRKRARYDSGSLSKKLTVTPHQILETHDPSHSPTAMYLAQSAYQDGIHATHFPQDDFTPFIPGNVFMDTLLESL
jgi:hypothetical protein